MFQKYVCEISVMIFQNLRKTIKFKNLKFHAQNFFNCRMCQDLKCVISLVCGSNWLQKFKLRFAKKTRNSIFSQKFPGNWLYAFFLCRSFKSTSFTLHCDTMLHLDVWFCAMSSVYKPKCCGPILSQRVYSIPVSKKLILT